MGFGEFTAVDNLAMDCHPIQGGIRILSVASCRGNQDKLQPDGPVGPKADFSIRFLVTDDEQTSIAAGYRIRFLTVRRITIDELSSTEVLDRKCIEAGKRVFTVDPY